VDHTERPVSRSHTLSVPSGQFFRRAATNVSAGGGLSTTQGDLTTFPRLADLIGFAIPEQIIRVAEQIITIQRDFGNRRPVLPLARRTPWQRLRRLR
jgi:hypothetical protein